MAGVHLQQLPAEVLREMWCREWLGSVQQFAECHNMRNSPRRLQAWLDGEIEDRSCEGEVVFFLFGMCQSMQWPATRSGSCECEILHGLALTPRQYAVPLITRGGGVIEETEQEARMAQGRRVEYFRKMMQGTANRIGNGAPIQYQEQSNERPLHRVRELPRSTPELSEHQLVLMYHKTWNGTEEEFARQFRIPLHEMERWARGEVSSGRCCDATQVLLSQVGSASRIRKLSRGRIDCEQSSATELLVERMDVEESEEEEESGNGIAYDVRDLTTRQLRAVFLATWSDTPERFCEQHGLSMSNFLKWVRGTRESSSASGAVHRFLRRSYPSGVPLSVLRSGDQVLENDASSEEEVESDAMESDGMEEQRDYFGAKDIEPELIGDDPADFGRLTAPELVALYHEHWDRSVYEFAMEWNVPTSSFQKWLEARHESEVCCKAVRRWLKRRSKAKQPRVLAIKDLSQRQLLKLYHDQWKGSHRGFCLKFGLARSSFASFRKLKSQHAACFRAIRAYLTMKNVNGVKLEDLIEAHVIEDDDEGESDEDDSALHVQLDELDAWELKAVWTHTWEGSAMDFARQFHCSPLRFTTWISTMKDKSTSYVGIVRKYLSQEYPEGILREMVATAVRAHMKRVEEGKEPIAQDTSVVRTLEKQTSGPGFRLLHGNDKLVDPQSLSADMAKKVYRWRWQGTPEDFVKEYGLRRSKFIPWLRDGCGYSAAHRAVIQWIQRAKLKVVPLVLKSDFRVSYTNDRCAVSDLSLKCIKILVRKTWTKSWADWNSMFGTPNMSSFLGIYRGHRRTLDITRAALKAQFPEGVPRGIIEGYVGYRWDFDKMVTAMPSNADLMAVEEEEEPIVEEQSNNSDVVEDAIPSFDFELRRMLSASQGQRLYIEDLELDDMRALCFLSWPGSLAGLADEYGISKKELCRWLRSSTTSQKISQIARSHVQARFPNGISHRTLRGFLTSEEQDDSFENIAEECSSIPIDDLSEKELRVRWKTTWLESMAKFCIEYRVNAVEFRDWLYEASACADAVVAVKTYLKDVEVAQKLGGKRKRERADLDDGSKRRRREETSASPEPHGLRTPKRESPVAGMVAIEGFVNIICQIKVKKWSGGLRSARMHQLGLSGFHLFLCREHLLSILERIQTVRPEQQFPVDAGDSRAFATLSEFERWGKQWFSSSAHYLQSVEERTDGLPPRWDLLLIEINLLRLNLCREFNVPDAKDLFVNESLLRLVSHASAVESGSSGSIVQELLLYYHDHMLLFGAVPSEVDPSAFDGDSEGGGGWKQTAVGLLESVKTKLNQCNLTSSPRHRFWLIPAKVLVYGFQQYVGELEPVPAGQPSGNETREQDESGVPRNVEALSFPEGLMDRSQCGKADGGSEQPGIPNNLLLDGSSSAPVGAADLVAWDKADVDKLNPEEFINECPEEREIADNGGVAGVDRTDVVVVAGMLESTGNGKAVESKDQNGIAKEDDISHVGAESKVNGEDVQVKEWDRGEEGVAEEKDEEDTAERDGMVASTDGPLSPLVEPVEDDVQRSMNNSPCAAPGAQDVAKALSSDTPSVTF